MSDYSSAEENVTGISWETVEGEVSEIQMLTQDAVSEKIRVYRSSNSPARGIDSAGPRNGDYAASGLLPQD